MRICMSGRGAVVVCREQCLEHWSSSGGFNLDGRAEASRSCTHAFVVGVSGAGGVLLMELELSRAGKVEMAGG